MHFFTDWALATGTGVWEGGGLEVDAEFLVSGFDGHATGADDTVRLKVCRAGQPEMVLLDTQVGAADFAFPTLVPDKGKIKIKTA